MPVIKAPDINDQDLTAAFKAHTEGQKEFTRRMAINIADWFSVTPRFVVLRLEALGLLKEGSWDWFTANGGITAEHVEEARSDRRYFVELAAREVAKWSDRYEIGFINDFGGGDTNWWADYLRAEVERANDFHADIHEQNADRIAALEAENAKLRMALAQASYRMRNARGAVESNQVTDKDVHGTLTRGMFEIAEALGE